MCILSSSLKLLSQLQPGGRGLGELFSFGRSGSGTNSLLTDLKDGGMLVASSISHYFASPCRLEARTEHAWGADPKAVLIELASGAGSTRWPWIHASPRYHMLPFLSCFISPALATRQGEAAIGSVPWSLGENISSPVYIKIEFPPNGANNETIMYVM